MSFEQAAEWMYGLPEEEAGEEQDPFMRIYRLKGQKIAAAD